MVDEGWIKLHRKFLDWEWFDSEVMVKLWIYLLLEANHEDKKWRGHIIRRGQVVASLGSLSEVLKISMRTLRTCLLHLEQTGEIDKQSTSQYTLITICNYDKYQVKEEPQRQASDKQPTSDRQATDKQTTTNKNDKNIYINNNTLSLRSWRFLSSVEKSICGNDKNRMAEMKKEIFRAEAESFAPELGMPKQQLESFIRYWGEHNQGSDKIKAEYEPTFDVRSRMESWMERERPRATGARPTEQPQKTKLQQTIEERNKFQQAIYGIFNNQPADSNPDCQ